ncbi:MAG: EAL domain-containing protein (putative c-di-GMP-specific phosphodiesterase class I) [Myxococcota bacterium]|jgi:EAL domain-containing protein (putative c-di-GMP-specific phosphodiesterase class I)
MVTRTKSQSADPAEGQRKRALVADDDPNARRFFARLLQLEGFEVATATNGIEARVVLAEGHWDIVLSDISMPGMGGIQLLQAIRTIDRDIPVILITGDPSVETAVKAVEYGAARYLTKPVVAADLRQCIRESVRAASAPEDLLTESFDRALGLIWPAFQPIVSLSKRGIHAYEALVRSTDVELNNPGLLLGAAEKLGRVRDLGRVIRDRVAEALPHAPDGVDIFVNLHPDELADERLASPDSPLAPWADRIVLEVTERARIEEVPSLQQNIDNLRDRGFRLAIDDLGAGYAGLQSFVSLRPELVKLDMSLIRGIDADLTRLRVVRSIHSLCTEIGIGVIAEGIETAEELATVASLGIDLIQGFFFARPEPPFTTVPQALFDTAK